MQWLHVGNTIEVLSESQHSYNTAKVISSTLGQVTVEYNEVVKDDGEALTETLSVDDKRLRPQLPQTVHRSDLQQYKVGETCDIFYQNAWWPGFVTAINTDEGIHVTRADDDGLSLPCMFPNDVRPGYEWGGGVWRRRVPRKNTLAKLKLMSTIQLEAFILTLAMEPDYYVDGTPAPRQLAAQPTNTMPGLSTATQQPQQSQLQQQQQPVAHALQQLQVLAGGMPTTGPASGTEQLLAGQPQTHTLATPMSVSTPPPTQEQQDSAAAAAAAAAAAVAAAATGGAWAAPNTTSPPGFGSQINAANGMGSTNQFLSDANDIAQKTALAAVAAAAAMRPPPQPQQPPPLTTTPPAANNPLAANVASLLQNNPQQLLALLAAINQVRPPAPNPAPAAPTPAAAAAANTLGLLQQIAAGKQLVLPSNPAGFAGVRPIRPIQARGPQAQQYAARLAHNESVRSDLAGRDGIRALYLKQHLDKLRPFVPPGVVANIEMRAARAPHNYVLPDPITTQPACIKGEMREYQLAGLAWLIRQYDHGINAILADEMGLGKTLQTIAFLAYLTFERKVSGPHLVVVPLSVLPNWMAEFKRFAPDLRVVRIHVNDEGERQRLRTEVLANPSSFDVAVTTYDMVNSVHFGDALKRTIVWRYLVLDEGHRVKNEDALISQGMRHVGKQHVLMLTGTPLQNNLHELWALLNFMFPDVFVSSVPFDQAFNLAQGKVDQRALEAAHHLLRPFMLRRVKDEVECKLPPKVETRINCPLSDCQTFWYRRLLMRECDVLKAVESSSTQQNQASAPFGFGADGNAMMAYGMNNGWGMQAGNPYNQDASHVQPTGGPGGAGTSHWQKMMNLLMQLRKVCNHPYLFNIDAEPDFDGQTTGEDIVEVSGKMVVLDKLLNKLKARGHRVVLFSQFSRMLDILEDYIRLRGWRYKRLDGSTNRIQRMIDIQQFNKPNSDIFLYILCTRAGGLGVNLQTADTCILFDSDWNPQQDLQAMARVHRIGQTRPVHVYRLVTEGTVEERIQKRAESKLFLDKMVNRNSTQLGDELEKLDKKEVLNMLKFGADRIFKNDAGREPTDAELDAIIDRSAMQAAMAASDEPQQQSQQQQAPPAVGADGTASHDTGSVHQPVNGSGTAEQHVKQELAAPSIKQETPPAPVKQELPLSGIKQEPFTGQLPTLPDGLGGVNSAAAVLAQLQQQQQQQQQWQQPLQQPQQSGLLDPVAAALAAVAVAASGNRPHTITNMSMSSHLPTLPAVTPLQGTTLPAQHPTATTGALMSGAQITAADFSAEEPPISTFEFAGVDYRDARANLANASTKELAQQYWAGKKRARKERLIKVDGHDVLKENNYSMQEGGISVKTLHPPTQFGHGRGGRGRGRRQIAGEDYSHCDFCQRCWDGGDLICCDFCPVSMHPACVGLSQEEVEKIKKWSCPHHTCATCLRSTAAAGGLLFRCEMCESAFCEDHLPDEYEIMGENEVFQGLGQIHPKQACFILCSPHCQQTKKDLSKTLEEMVARTAALRAEEQAAKMAQEAEQARLAEQTQAAGARKRARAAGVSDRDLGYTAPGSARVRGRGRGRGRGRIPGGDPMSLLPTTTSGGYQMVEEGGGYYHDDDDDDQDDSWAAPVRRRRGGYDDDDDVFEPGSSEGDHHDDDDDDFDPSGSSKRGGKRGRT